MGGWVGIGGGLFVLEACGEGTNFTDAVAWRGGWVGGWVGGKRRRRRFG